MVELEPCEIGLDAHFINSLAGVHDNPQTAFKDLVANAITAQATELHIEIATINQKNALILHDNGTGPSSDGATVDLPSYLKLLFKLGASTAQGDSGAVGQFGCGAITGALGVATNVVIATRSNNGFYAALLSLDMLNIDASSGDDRARVPYLVFDRHANKWSESEPETFARFRKHTVFTKIGTKLKEELLQTCNSKLPKQGGLLHVMSGIKDTIDYGKHDGDITMTQIRHPFDCSLSRYLAYSFYGSHKELTLKVKNKMVSWSGQV
jgi:hypothetical protein